MSTNFFSTKYIRDSNSIKTMSVVYFSSLQQYPNTLTLEDFGIFVVFFLSVESTSIVLFVSALIFMERTRGFEPRPPSWSPGMLPLNHQVRVCELRLIKCSCRKILHNTSFGVFHSTLCIKKSNVLDILSQLLDR